MGGGDGKWDIPEVVGKKEKLEGNVTLTPYIYDDPQSIRPPYVALVRIPVAMS